VKNILIAIIAFACNGLDAQTFRLMRYDEEYSHPADSARSFYNGLKYIPLSQNKAIYASVGGEARLEYVDFNNEDWGRLNVGHNNFFLQRYNLHLDMHLGKNFRVFGQLRSALQDGSSTGPGPFDEDRLNLQNLFADAVIFQKEGKTLTARLGRQELNYGSGRLISVGEGPNVRRYFTGGKVFYKSPKLLADAFVMMADDVHHGVFDNTPTRNINLWGGYATVNFSHSSLDAYYLGINRNATFEEGPAREVRHTTGIRYFKTGNGFIYNLEAVYQLGTFGNGSISAWTASADVGYCFEHVTFSPAINLRHDYISGDKKPADGSLQTFNPLYPRGGYFGFSPQTGPVNLIDVHPYATLSLLEQLQFQADVVFNMRYSVNDGVYNPSGTLNLEGAASAERYIGTAYLASLSYTVNPFTSVNTGIQYFKAGAFLHDIIPNAKDGIFFNIQLSFMF
jgi:hypothetical protein